MSKPATDITGASYKAYGGNELSWPLWMTLCRAFTAHKVQAPSFLRAAVFNRISR